MSSRFRDAMLRWCREKPSGACSVAIGRQASTREAILDTTAWLVMHGYHDADIGWLQCYALWLLERRDEYARKRGDA